MDLHEELEAARLIYVEAIDNGDEQTELEYSEIVNQLAKQINNKTQTTYSQWYINNEHPIENLECPNEIIADVRDFAKNPKGFNKEVVEEWNQYLSFDLHAKLKTYGMVGAARLNKIFKL
tara:strand:+ start:138 stop:497 length:360 start_codon:yes stop_codon:yes gene_type:complete